LVGPAGNWRHPGRRSWIDLRRSRAPMRRWLEIGPPSQSDGDCPSKRDDHKAEVEPGPISLSVLRKHENMDYEPHTRREPQSKPNQIFGGLMCRPNCFALGTAYTCNDDDERPARCNGSAALSAQQCRLARQARARCEQAVRMTEPTALIAANLFASRSISSLASWSCIWSPRARISWARARQSCWWSLVCIPKASHSQRAGGVMVITQIHSLDLPREPRHFCSGAVS
jgi:hypothetical protein